LDDAVEKPSNGGEEEELAEEKLGMDLDDEVEREAADWIGTGERSSEETRVNPKSS